MIGSNICREKFRARRLLRVAVGALIWACFAAGVGALDPARSLSQYLWEGWSIEKGFPGGAVTAIVQTGDGYLWIGTDKGLLRFDGMNFRVFSQATPTPFSIGGVERLEADSEGNLWILLQNTKVLRYAKGRFEPGRDEAEVGITAIGRRKDRAVLFSSLAYGTLTYENGKFQILGSSESAPTVSAGSTTNANDTLSTRLSWATSVASHHLAEPDSAVVSLAEGGDGKIWLATRDKGLFSLLHGQVVADSQDIRLRNVTCLLPLEHGGLWIATENGILEWNGTELTQSGVPPALRQAKVLAMVRDRDSNIWLGTSRGLLRFNGAGVSSASGERNAASGPVTALFEDREGNLWAGSPRGIERVRNGAFVTYSAGSLQSESSGPIYVGDDGRAWFAPFEGGLEWLKDGTTGVVTNDRLNGDVVYSITGSKDELWVGRQRGGLTQMRFSRGAVTTTTYTEADGLAQDGVYAVYAARDRSVWAATLSKGVSRYSDGRFVTYSTATGMTSDTVTSMAETPDGTVWFATPTGLNAFSNGQWRALTVRDGMPSNNLNCLLSDSRGTLWIGTISGLALVRSGRVESLGQAPAVLHEAILGIAEDGNGRLWIATADHILAVRREALLRAAFREGDLRVFGIEDGLLGTGGVKRERSVFADRFGRIWFSTTRGLSVADTAREFDNALPAAVRVEGVSVDGTAVDLAGPIRVQPGSHRVTFTYSGVSLSVPERLRFKYKLDGFDQGWSEPVAAREAVYTNLDSGTYHFHLMASNSDGVWSSAEPSLSIAIEPFYWKSWWFRLSAALLVVLLLATYLRLRMQRLAEQIQIRFEERLAERTRIARELHDSLLQGFQGLMFRLQAAREMLPERPADAAEALDIALDRGDQAIAEGRSTVEDLRSSSSRDSDIVQALTTLGEELARPNHGQPRAALRVLVEGKPRRLDPTLRDEIYRLAREALRNAFQHSQARKIEAEVTFSEAQFSLRVRDDGNGIDPSVFQQGSRPGHWGLPGMRERASGFGGQLHVWTEAGAGTEIELTVPGVVAYGASSNRPRFWFSKIGAWRTHGRRL